MSQFVDLEISGQKIASKPSSFPPAIVAVAGITGALALIAAFGVYVERRNHA